MVSINRITFSMEIFLKNPVLNDNAKFADAFVKNGFSLSYGTPEQPVMMKERFTVRTARAPRVMARAINLAAISLAAKDVGKFVEYIMNVKEILAKELRVDFDSEFKNYSTLVNAWVATQNNPFDVLSKLKDVDGIGELKGFTCHRTPFDKLEFVSESSQGMLDYDEWHKLEVDSAGPEEYLLSLHYYGNSLARATENLKKCAEKITSIVNRIEEKVLS
jgi:hypothetical protein